MNFKSTKIIELGSCAFRQFGANHSHCQYLHGYQLKAKFVFGSSTLDSKNWVVDFGGLKKLKETLHHQFDHTLCIAANDPCLDLFKQLENAGACILRIMPDGVGIEKTAEWCFEAASSFVAQHYGDRCWVESVEVFEHEANSAIYSKPKEITYTKAVHSIETQDLPNITSTNNVQEPEVKTVAENTISSAAGTDSGNIHRPEGVPLRNPVTTGWSNPFKGTSWGV
jgi:6-pyruvoyltetrahydropterin/6-carboxytetrahydropterin synthase